MQVPSKRSPKRRKDARPGEILSAALAEFDARGFAGATLTGIANRADISRGTIYLYYADKDALFDALMRRRLTDPLEEIDAMLDDYEGDSEGLLEVLFAQLHSDAASPETITLLRMLIAEGHRFPHLVRLHHDRIMEVGAGLLERIVARGVASGEFTPNSLALDTRVLIAPALMAVIWRMVFANVSEIDGKAILQDHLKVVLDGLRPRKTRG